MNALARIEQDAVLHVIAIDAAAVDCAAEIWSTQ